MTRSIAVALLAAALTTPAFAIDYNWTNTTGGNWNVGGNWNPAAIPTATDNATITAVGTYAVALTDSRSINNFTLNNATVTFNHTGGLIVGGAFTFSAGTYNLSGGWLRIDGSMTAAAGTTFIWGAGTLGGAGTTR